MKQISQIVFLLALITLTLSGCFRQKAPENKTLSTAINLVVSTTPTQGEMGVLENSSITLNFAQPMDKTSVERSLSLFTGKYDPASSPSTFKKLQLTFTCNGRWKITNPNSVPISFTWNTEITNEQGLGVVPANGSTFFYSVTNGNKARLYVNNVLQDTEPSNQDPCNTSKGSFVWSADAKTVTFTRANALGK